MCRADPGERRTRGKSQNPRSLFIIRVPFFCIFSLSKIPPMKKLLFLFLIAALRLNAQSYPFTQLTDPYVDLTGPTTLTTSTPWTYASAFTVPIGFNFTFMGMPFTTLYVEGSGFTYFDANYYYLCLPFTVKLASKGTSGNNSPISYSTTGSVGSRILKVQWKNAGFHYDTTSTMNFQLWLYETTNIIEMHYGSSNVANPALVYQENGSDGPVVGLYEYATSINCTYSVCLNGNAAAPQALNPTGNFFLFGTSILGTPSSGTVYKFDPWSVGIDEYNASSFTISNVSGDFVLINSESPVENCTLYALDGKTAITRQPEGQQLFIGDLPAGMYIIEAQISGVVSRQKLVISH